MGWYNDRRNTLRSLLLALLVLLAAACNLTSAPQQQIDLTDVPTSTVLPTRTVISTGDAPTPVTVTSLPIPTQIGQRPTSIAVLPPTAVQFPTPSPLPVNIVILSPIPGSVVAGNVQVIGAASHPSFLQYQLEWGPDPNPGDLWFLASGVSQNPVMNGLLGNWNTTGVQDGTYQLRLKVFLRDGTSLATVVNNIRVQNQVPTVAPTPTTIARPIAAFSQDRTVGQAPLVVRFFNQSSGNITSRSWNFGDGGSSSENNPTHTFRNPGVYTVTLRVQGPGGSSNVSRQITVQSSTPPVAGFTQNTTSGESPLTVQFTDQSQGSVTQRVWNFGDGTTSSETNPSRTFEAVGTYNVILTVFGPGGSSSATRQITVQNPTIPEPIAALVPSQTQGNTPLTVQFDASDSSGQIDSYNWNFGDGELGSGRIVTHTFDTSGIYNVRLVVVGPGGQSEANVEITAVQPPDAPLAAIQTNTESGEVPLTVQFDASGSTGPIDVYRWNFGDGTVGEGATVEHVYNAAGTYTAELIVEGPGGTDTETVEISAVEPVEPPQAAFESSPSSGPAPLEVQFINQSEGEELTFTWNFGDGSAASNERDPRHTYADPGDYEVTLQVSGPGGDSEATGTITVIEPDAPPSAAFDASPLSGPAPLAVQFVNQTAGEELTFAWDFGDGADSTERDPAHTFDTPGEYTVTLTVTGPGGSSSADRVISVTEPIAPPDASFNADPTSGEAPLTVNFDSTGSPDSIASYFWEFGDGGTSLDPDPQHIYTQPGSYTARLSVTGPDGREDSAETTITVSQAVVIAPPVAGFTVAPSSGTVGEPVQFTSTTTGDVTSYEWSFGDGATSTETNPQHTYTAAGDYTVTLRAVGPGGENTAQQPYSVAEAAQPPVAAFTVAPPSGTVGEPVQFTSTTTGDVTSYEWSFGDGATSTEANPQHTYTAAGDYTVSLRAVGPGGENTAQQPYSVAEAAQPPVAAFTVAPPSGTVGEPVQFTSTTTGDVTSYEWSFGDGATSTEASPQHTYTAAGDYTVTLRAVGPGGENTAQQPYSVAEAAQPPVAAFTVAPPSGTVGEPVQFTSTTTGDVTSYEWSFGDGATSTEANPQHTYTAAGDYTVTLRAVGPGGENTAQQPYSVVEAAQPPVAAFTVEPPSGTVGEPVQFTSTTTGDVTSYEWNFGDGATSTEASPQHTYTAAGDYTVTLRAVGPGGENTAQQPYSVVEVTAPPEPNLAEQLPVFPEGDVQQLRNRLRAIFDNGAAQGRRAGVFAVIGGDMALQNGYLDPFADPGLDTGADDLESIIEWYNQVDVGDGRSSFDRDSAATGAGWRIRDLLDPNRSGGNCNPGETPLECELRLIQPAVALVSIGLNDVGTTDPETFRADMEQVLQILINNGVIPIVSTVQPVPNNADQVRAINNALIEAAQNVEASNNTVVAVYNLWRAYTELPGNGLEGNNVTPTTAPAGPGVLSSDAVGTYATNTRNANILTLLHLLRTQVFPDATP